MEVTGQIGRPIVLPTLGGRLSPDGLHLQFSPNTKQTNKTKNPQASVIRVVL